MAIQTLAGEAPGGGTFAVLTCTTSGIAFGPVFKNYETAEEFLVFAGERNWGDVRGLSPVQFDTLITEWNYHKYGE